MSPLRLLAAALALTLVCALPAQALEIRQFQLKSGATLLVSEQHQLPMVTLAIAFDAGSRRDPKGQEGLAALTASSLMQGTKSLSADQFNLKVDFMGSGISVSAGTDYAEASLASLKKYEDQTLKLLVDILQEPGLRVADIERKRDEQVAALKAAEEQPGYVAEVTFAKTLFDGAPYGHLPSGTVESVSKLTPADVKKFYEKYYRLGGAVIVAVGDVSADEIREKLERAFNRLRGSVPAQTPPPPPRVEPGIHAELINRDVQQANIVLGAPGIARSNPDFYRLQVMNYILGGGGFASRLVKSVRSKEGLAYSVASFFDAQKFEGPFMAVLQTRNQSANQALRLVLDEMRGIQEKPVSDAELASAKKYLIGSFPLKIDRQSAIATFILQTQLYGLGLDYAERYPKLIEAVTREDVQQVARRYLHPEAMVLVAVADQQKAAIKVEALDLRKQSRLPGQGGGR